MNAENVACASSAAVAHWDQIDWKQCEQRVARLQARIVKASRVSRWGKVRCLQRLLTCSFSGKALAVKRVTENKGKRTSGVDHVIWSTPPLTPCRLSGERAAVIVSDKIVSRNQLNDAVDVTGWKELRQFTVKDVGVLARTVNMNFKCSADPCESTGA
jgi:hypothetical protein